MTLNDFQGHSDWYQNAYFDRNLSAPNGMPSFSCLFVCFVLFLFFFFFLLFLLLVGATRGVTVSVVEIVYID